MIKRKKDFLIKDYLMHGMFFTLYGLFKYWPSPVGDIPRSLIVKAFLKKSQKIRIYEGVTIWYPYNIEVGHNVTLNETVYLSGYGNIKIGNNVRIGKGTTIITSDHNIPSKDLLIKDSGLSKDLVVIGNDVFIGCNVTILKGVTIGDGSVIGACSLVTKSIPSYSIAVGNPAKVIKQRS